MDVADDLARLERRLVGIDAVGTVVQAMRALARAQLPEADAAAAEATRYVDELDEIIARLARPPSAASAGRLAVVLGPARPLCGPLPRRVARRAAAEGGAIALVGGRTLEAYTLAGGRPPEFTHEGPTSAVELDGVARDLATLILAHARGRVVELVHPLADRSELRRSELLGGPRRPHPSPPETLSPLEDVLAHAVREVTTARLRVALAESLRVEVAARLVAAEAAHQAVTTRREELLTAWRVARQGQITAEILELVTGRSAGTSSAGDEPEEDPSCIAPSSTR